MFILSHVAEMLGEDEEWLFEVAEEMDTEDGQLWVVGVGEDGVMAFTDEGIENLVELIPIHKEIVAPQGRRSAPHSVRGLRRLSITHKRGHSKFRANFDVG